MFYPKQVIEIMMDLDFEAIKGNHEGILFDIECGNVELSTVTAKYGSGHANAIRELTSGQMDFLFSLPYELKLEILGTKISLHHETPWNNNKNYIYPNTEIPETLNNNSDYVFFGHSHYQFSRKLQNNIIFNPGSVGLNREKGGIANWIELDITYNSLKFHSTQYLRKDLIKKIIQIDGRESYNYKVLNR
jgi:predicted phosphodiesterase